MSRLARPELLDALTVTRSTDHSKTTLKEQPTLFLEFHGTASSVEEQAEAVQEIAGHGGRDFEWAVDPEDRARACGTRGTRPSWPASCGRAARAFVTDACVPISRLAECITATIEDTRASSLPCPILGHVGDGNFHCIIVADPGIPPRWRRPSGSTEGVMRRCARDGRDVHRRARRRHAQDRAAQRGVRRRGLDLMRRLKAAWDPLNILNPGKGAQAA